MKSDSIPVCTSIVAVASSNGLKLNRIHVHNASKRFTNSSPKISWGEIKSLMSKIRTCQIKLMNRMNTRLLVKYVRESYRQVTLDTDIEKKAKLVIYVKVL